MKLKILLLCVALVAAGPVFADPYMNWESEIHNASKGLFVCMDSHERSLSGRLTAPQKAQKQLEANERCQVLKGVFETTMLVARTHVEGMDRHLAGYHEVMMAMFEDVRPEEGQSLASYMVYAQKTKMEVLQARLVLMNLSTVSR